MTTRIRQRPASNGPVSNGTRTRRPAARRFAILAAAVVVTMGLSGCVPAFLPQPSASTSSPTGESVSSALDPFYNQVLTWTDCGNSLQCTTAKAPLDWSAPGTDTVDLALVRHVATGTRVGSLLVNPGGPGGSGYDFVKGSLDYATDAKLQAGFDIVGFDPRGVGRSSAVKCYGAAEMDQYLYAIPTAARGTDAWIQEVEKSSTDFGAACATNTGALLAHVDTVSAAHDLDMLRAVLGDAQLNYLGYSYGTFLGATYANLFPDKVGRLVLDGALDPSTSNAEVTRVQAVGFESALRSYLADCLAGSKCPFNGTVDQAMTTISALLDSVDRSPIAASDGRMLGANTLLTAIIYPLYQASAWPNLSEMLSSVMQGNTKIAFQFADAYNGRNSDGTYLDNSTEAFLAINCLDYSYNDDPAVMRADAAAIEAAAPVIGKYMAYGDTGCANWPDKFTGTRAEIHAPGAAPILVVGTTNDPATPYVWAQSLARQLDSAQLVTYAGEGHTAYNKSNACVNNAVDSYLLQGTVPATDPKC
ncbi:alpha/beta hydrolase [Cryobacterium sp. 10I1]|uniref:alpha/beta hydrolase n=1 Tax=unclassified Cryobacterium TaxID=2649013 RepID=UPI002AC8AFBE|nr:MULTISPECIES: alpha/beta hydrolase [unclassified Cryobacterium]MEB0002767.1 alpha/beta hydrolase [Cryobacterium sp. RTC2.1]MEB0201579.1 alpha/beta hydrolase [Cryobacterium sp. 5I3]MEB0285012.1 alpha/beta hydrolase [Cryobacterium sp. 10S3]MEB0306473.1 alpha/beta hydrolase [Cryobacterium sp. 10I1]WPX13982.1 alpha/beta hydrolase [Cryobacterium sp. 10S3]